MVKSTSNIIHSSGTEPEATSTSSFVLAPQPQPQRNPAGGCNHHLQQGSPKRTLQQEQKLVVVVVPPGPFPYNMAHHLRGTPTEAGGLNLVAAKKKGETTFRFTKDGHAKETIAKDLHNYVHAPDHPYFEKYMPYIPREMRYTFKCRPMMYSSSSMIPRQEGTVVMFLADFQQEYPNLSSPKLLNKAVRCNLDVDWKLLKNKSEMKTQDKDKKHSVDFSVLVERARQKVRERALSVPAALPGAARSPTTLVQTNAARINRLQAFQDEQDKRRALPFSPPTTNPFPTTNAVAPSTGALFVGPTALAAPSTVAPVATGQQATLAVAPASAATAVAALPATGTVSHCCDRSLSFRVCLIDTFESLTHFCLSAFLLDLVSLPSLADWSWFHLSNGRRAVSKSKPFK